ncbi:BTB/POZ domain-containing protein 3 [Nilaparvata lugens]|uniref:BTB/POZ domain-containing protein 3 n=1 Tax=Nilaparvata lugens TaxID=108931 RepID=UPI00193DB597|nr:BTB/POZ domain-containing protein 3 [Nilaparvata lugens]
MDLKRKYNNSSKSNFKKRKFDERFLHLLENGIDCDCEFVVGVQSIVIRGHSFLFSAASEVFHAMFYGDFKKEKSVEVKDLDPEGFEGMKKFIYTGEIEFESALQALSVYIAARKYMISSLSQQCVNFITEDNTIQPSEVLEFDEICRAHNIPEFEKTCYKIIQQKTDKIIESEFFVSAAPETIELILRSPSLRLDSEIDVLHLFEKWVMAKAERKGIAIGKIMATKTINNLKKHIRFLTISSDKFVSDVADSPILTSKEKIAIACNLKDSDLKPLPESVSLERQLRNFIFKSKQKKKFVYNYI